jgi:hypothetical protein
MGAAHLFRWDLDKTYLQTEFETLRGMWRTLRERPEDKRSYPGAAELLASLSQEPEHRIGIVSGSPRQMRPVLERKLEMDGVEFDQLELKPQLESMARFRFRALREQIGYKLPALLEGRERLGPTLPETLVGDDVELDALIYSLYADLLAGGVPAPELEEVLERARVHSDARVRIRALCARIEPADRVQRILVHLDRRSPPARFDAFGSRMVPFHNYLQAAAILYGDGRLRRSVAQMVARSLVAIHGFAPEGLASSLEDLVRRGGLDYGAGMDLAECLDTDPLLARARFAEHLRLHLPGTAPHAAREPKVRPGYPELFEMERARRVEFAAPPHHLDL